MFWQGVFVEIPAAVDYTKHNDSKGGVTVRRTVLIVDDNGVNRSVLRKILSEQYETLEAGDGWEALNIVAERGAGLSAILLDLIMPGMDGFTFLRELRQRYGESNIPVIVMTGEDNEATEIRALGYGATDFLGKPYRPQIILARLHNIIGLREASARVDRVARDSLTGLYNREGFYEQLERLMAEEPDAPVEIVAMDIGNFKLVNDLYGEAAGDELIRSVACSVQKSFGGGGSILARKTGDQFLFAFPRGGMDGQKMWQISQTWAFPLDMALPFRFGIYQTQGLREPVSVMCDNAKLAADSVRGRYDVHTAVYDRTMRRRLVADQKLTEDLEEGLRAGQFEAWYQPKCDPLDGRIVGAEALVRWNHPERGTLTPDQFVPLFERNRLITRLDRFMWERVCRDLSAWQKQGKPSVPVSVNVSRVDVYQRDLVRRLRDLVRGLEIDPAALPLEITESAYGDDAVQLKSTVKRLRKLGFRVEMDDFGSGWSSLNILTSLHLDGVKLDMRFLRENLSDDRGERFFRHLLEMMGDLGLSVTAEGVENAGQAEFLAAWGCHSAQGLYFAPPLPREEFEKFLLEHL